MTRLDNRLEPELRDRQDILNDDILTKTPAQIRAWVNSNVNNTTDIRQMLMTLTLALAELVNDTKTAERRSTRRW